MSQATIPAIKDEYHNGKEILAFKLDGGVVSRATIEGKVMVTTGTNGSAKRETQYVIRFEGDRNTTYVLPREVLLDPLKSHHPSA